MKNVFILNGHQKYKGIAEGNLTQSYVDKAKSFFEDNGFNVEYTHIEKGFVKEKEIEKFINADYILFQYPVNWMGMPWKAKRYFDHILTQGKQFAHDGRTRSDPNKTYGTGGLLNSKYMLSLTFNCPLDEFNNKDRFFEGMSIDEASVATHKIFQFCGLTPLETYAINDVFKADLDFDSEMKRFEELLKKNFS